MGGGRVERESRSIAFARAYDDHVWDVYGYFAYRLSSRDDAEDLTQLTFERALKAWDRFDARRATVGTWLLAIARNLLVDHYRRDRSRHEEAIGDGEWAGATRLRGARATWAWHLPRSGGDSSCWAARARGARAALRGDLTGPEIAELTGLTLSNVQQMLSRSLRRHAPSWNRRIAPDEGTSVGKIRTQRRADRRPRPRAPIASNAVPEPRIGGDPEAHPLWPPGCRSAVSSSRRRSSPRNSARGAGRSCSSRCASDSSCSALLRWRIGIKRSDRCQGLRS